MSDHPRRSVNSLPLCAPLLAPLLLAAGCTTWDGFLDNSGRRHGVTTAEHASQPVAEPQSRNYFVLETPGQSVVGELQVVQINEGDTFPDLAREYGLGYDELIAANPGIDPWLPAAGTPVLLPTQYVLPAAPRRGLVLNIAAKRLFYFPEVTDDEPQPVLTYPIGIGRVGWETPLGTSKVISMATDPHWYPPASVRQEHAELGDPLPGIVPPGPDNPLGRHVLKLDLPGYLIHGTNQPYGVGMRVSHGCVRLYPENIETLYSMVSLGEPVTIVSQPYLLGVRGGRLYFEGHAPLEDESVDTGQHLDALLDGAVNSGLLHGEAEQVAAQMRVVASDARGIPVLVQKGDVDEIYERALLVRNTVEADPDAPTLTEVREMIEQLPPVDEPPAEAVN